MSNKLSQLAETLIPSEIITLGNEIRDRVQQGEKIYNFTIGDFDPAVFPIPQEMEDCIVQSYRDHNTCYPPADGTPDLRQAVSAFIEKWEGLQYGPNEILIAAGGRPLIYSLYRAVADRGDKIIYPAPSWNNNHYVHFVEGEHVLIEATRENDFMPTAADIKPHLKGACLLALNSSLNPTGTAFSYAELEAICDLVLEENRQRGENEKKLYVMYDQMYWTLTFGETKHFNPVSIRPEMRQYTIFIDGISKAFAATGVRVGWAMGPAHVLAKMRGINSHVGAWAPMPEQKGVAKYLVQHDAVERHLVSFRAEVDERLRRIYQGLQELKAAGHNVDAIAHQAAIYLTVQFDLVGKTTADGKLLEKQEDVTAYLLDEAKLAVVPFYAFGAKRTSNWYRLSVGTCKKEGIDEMLGMLRAALEKLK
jgi:aspartate aminotransferase